MLKHKAIAYPEIITLGEMEMKVIQDALKRCGIPGAYERLKADWEREYTALSAHNGTTSIKGSL